MTTEPISIPDLKGKAVLITGASTGIGAALARAFAAQGAHVAINYKSNQEAAKALASELEASGGKVVLVQGDVSTSHGAGEVVSKAADLLGGIDGLINNAGAMVARVLYENMTDDHYDKVMDLNGRSVVAASTAVIPFLKEKGGFIINTTSVAARTGGTAGSGLYGSSKAFVGAITKGLAMELGKYNIRVNAVAPGFIVTPFQEKYALPGQEETVAKSVPLQRAGTPEDCVGAYLFLASSQLAGYVTGQTVDVNGGQYMP